MDELPILDFMQMDSLRCTKLDALEMEIGRGCPFDCTYCSTSRFWGRNYRIKGVDRTIQEIQNYMEKYGTRIFLFQHDCTEITDRYFEQLEFDSTYFETTKEIVSLPSDILAMIKKHKQVFPQYYVMPKMNDKRYRFLAGFVNGLFSSFYYLEHELVCEAINIHSGNILSLYFDVYEKNPQDIEQIYHFLGDKGNYDKVYIVLRNVLKKSMERKQK